jgi:hypothetical protein
LKVNRCFGGICHLYLQGSIIIQARNQGGAGGKQAARFDEPGIKTLCLIKSGQFLERLSDHKFLKKASVP